MTTTTFPGLDDFEILPPTDEIAPSEGTSDSSGDDHQDRPTAAHRTKSAGAGDAEDDDDLPPPPPDDDDDEPVLPPEDQRHHRHHHQPRENEGASDQHQPKRRKSRGNIRWGAPAFLASSPSPNAGETSSAARGVASDSAAASSILFMNKDVFSVQQALKYRNLMKPNPTPISTAEEASLLALIEHYLTANGFQRSVQQLRSDRDTAQLCTSFNVPLTSDRLPSLRLPELDLDLPGLVKDTVRKTCLLFDDDVAWPADNLFSTQFPLADSKSGSGPSASSSSPTSSPPMAQTALHQHASLAFLIEKLVLEQKDVPFTENGKFDVTFTNVFLVCSCYFSCPDTLFSLFSKMYKTVAAQGALFGERRKNDILCRVLLILLAWVKCSSVDFTRLVLERVASFAVNVVHCSGASSSGDVVQTATELLLLVQQAMKRQVVYAGERGAQSDEASSGEQRTTISTCHWLKWCNLQHENGAFGRGKGANTAATAPSSSSSALLPTSNLPQSAMKSTDLVHYVTDIHDVELARHLTLTHSELFHAIGVRELFQNAWVDTNLQHVAKNFLDFMKHFEDVSLWVASCVVTPPTLELRSSNYCKLIRVGKLLYDMQNFSLAQSVLNGLEHHTVTALHRTVASLPAQEGDVLDALRIALDPQRQVQKSIPHTSVATPCIPFLGPYISDICTTEETKESFISVFSAAAADGGPKPYQSTLMHVNWSKMVEIGRVVCRLLAFQSVDYRFGVLPNVMAYVSQLPGKRDAEVLYALAKEREGKK